jgi:hypothetical protein
MPERSCAIAPRLEYMSWDGGRRPRHLDPPPWEVHPDRLRGAGDPRGNCPDLPAAHQDPVPADGRERLITVDPENLLDAEMNSGCPGST